MEVYDLTTYKHNGSARAEDAFPRLSPGYRADKVDARVTDMCQLRELDTIIVQVLWHDAREEAVRLASDQHMRDPASDFNLSIEYLSAVYQALHGQPVMHRAKQVATGNFYAHCKELGVAEFEAGLIIQKCAALLMGVRIPPYLGRLATGPQNVVRPAHQPAQRGFRPASRGPLPNTPGSPLYAAVNT